MGIIKHRIPPFAIGLVIGSLLSIWLVSAWQKERRAAELAAAVAPAHRALADSGIWINASRAVAPEELTGRWLALNFFSYAGVNSLESWAEVEKLAIGFGEGMAIIGVHAAKFDGEKQEESLRAAVARQGIRQFVINDKDFRLWKAFSVHAWPTLVLIDPSGKVFATQQGRYDVDELLRKLRETAPPTAESRPRPPLPLAPEAPPVPTVTGLRFPTKLASGQGLLWVADSGNHRVLGIDTETGDVKTTIGSGQPGSADGDFTAAEFHFPSGLAYHGGKLWVADTRNHAVRVVDLAKGSVGTIAGVSGGSDSYPVDLAVSRDGRALFLAMSGGNQIWKIDLRAQKAAPVAGKTGVEGLEDGRSPTSLLAQPKGLSEAGGVVFFVDSESSALRALLRNGEVKTLVGSTALAFGFLDGPVERALFQHPEGLYVAGNEVFIADTLNHAIRRFDRARKVVGTVSGKAGRGFVDGKFAEAKFFEPTDIERIGTLYYVADSGNHVIRIVDLNIGDVRTLTLRAP